MALPFKSTPWRVPPPLVPVANWAAVGTSSSGLGLGASSTQASLSKRPLLNGDPAERNETSVTACLGLVGLEVEILTASRLVQDMSMAIVWKDQAKAKSRFYQAARPFVSASSSLATGFAKRLLSQDLHMFLVSETGEFARNISNKWRRELTL
jgi:hypothetical protein